MRMLFVLIATALLAGCALADPAPRAATPLSGAPAAVGLQGYGTLALNPLEAELAPLLTRNAVLRASATRSLQAGRLTADQAQQVLALTDAARSHIDAAGAEPQAQKRAALRARASQAQAQAAEIIAQGDRL